MKNSFLRRRHFIGAGSHSQMSASLAPGLAATPSVAIPVLQSSRATLSVHEGVYSVARAATESHHARAWLCCAGARAYPPPAPPREHIPRGASDDVSEVTLYERRHEKVRSTPFERCDVQAHVHHTRHDNHIHECERLPRQSKHIGPSAVGQGYIGKDQVGLDAPLKLVESFRAGSSPSCLNR